MALVGSWVEKTLLCWSLMGWPSMTKVLIAKQPGRTQPGARGDVGHQAALVAELGIRRAGHHLHALNGAGGKLGGKDFALLVANGLAVDDEGALRVIAQGMEETVAIG